MVECQLGHLGCGVLQFGVHALGSSETSVASCQTARGRTPCL